AVIASSHAHPRNVEVLMPIDFVGDWCADGDYQGSTWYTLPSHTGRNGVWDISHCTNILSVHKYGYYYIEAGVWKTYCDIEKKSKVEKGTAPSGPSYTATITFRCRPEGGPSPGELQTLEFYRYKGSLRVTPK